MLDDELKQGKEQPHRPEQQQSFSTHIPPSLLPPTRELTPSAD